MARTTAPKTSVAAAAKPATTTHRPATRGAKRRELALEVAREIERLRGNCKDMLQAFELRVGAQLAAAAETLAPAAESGEKGLPRVSQLQDALAAIHEVTLKPAKGRAKDFARLEKLADTLADLLADNA